MLAEGGTPPTWPPLGAEEFKFLRLAHGPDPLNGSPPRGRAPCGPSHVSAEEFEFSRVELELSNIRLAQALGRRQRETLHLQQHLQEIDQAVCQLREHIAEQKRIADNTDVDLQAAKGELDTLWKNVSERRSERKKEKKQLQDRIDQVQEETLKTQWESARKTVERDSLMEKVKEMEAASGCTSGESKNGGTFKKGNGLSWRNCAAQLAETNRKIRAQATEAEQRHAWLKRRCDELKCQGQSLRELVAEVQGTKV